jgi:hypothetical protein
MLTERTYRQTDLNQLRAYATLIRRIIGDHWKVECLREGTLIIHGCSAKIECWMIEDGSNTWAAFDVVDMHGQDVASFGGSDFAKMIAVVMAHPDRLRTEREDIHSWVMYARQIAATKISQREFAD